MKLMCPVVGAVGVLVNAYVYNLSHTVQLVRHRALHAIPSGMHAFAGGIRAHMVASRTGACRIPGYRRTANYCSRWT